MSRIDVMHGINCVAIVLEARAMALTPEEADQLAQRLREQAKHARDLALAPREEPEEVAPDLEPAPSAATIAGVMAIVDAPYQPGLDVRFEEDA
jgi:hypothetical protein